MAEPRRNTRVAKTAKTKPMDEYGHLQPQAPELEEAVLGALMIEKDAYSLVSEILRPESFYEHRHQLIYAAITDLAIQQKPIDILTVAEQLRSRGNLEEAGGPFYITQLSDIERSARLFQITTRAQLLGHGQDINRFLLNSQVSNGRINQLVPVFVERFRTKNLAHQRIRILLNHQRTQHGFFQFGSLRLEVTVLIHRLGLSRLCHTCISSRFCHFVFV